MKLHKISIDQAFNHFWHANVSIILRSCNKNMRYEGYVGKYYFFFFFCISQYISVIIMELIVTNLDRMATKFNNTINTK